MNVPVIIAMGGGANQGAAIFVSWVAAGLAIVVALVARRFKKKPLSVFATLVGVAALMFSGFITHLFGWWTGHIISAAIICFPIVLEICGITLTLTLRRKGI